MIKRTKDWEKRLKNVIEKHMALPSVYGTSDCYLIADDAVEALIGEQMFPDCRSYTSEIGAAKLLKSKNFVNVEDAFASMFEKISPSLAHRGDIGVMLNDQGQVCGGVFTALGFMSRDDVKIIFLPVSRVKSAFKVGR
jgi:hypothetical protein